MNKKKESIVVFLSGEKRTYLQRKGEDSHPIISVEKQRRKKKNRY